MRYLVNYSIVAIISLGRCGFRSSSARHIPDLKCVSMWRGGWVSRGAHNERGARCKRGEREWWVGELTVRGISLTKGGSMSRELAASWKQFKRKQCSCCAVLEAAHATPRLYSNFNFAIVHHTTVEPNALRVAVAIVGTRVATQIVWPKRALVIT